MRRSPLEREFFLLLAFVATGTGLMVVVAKNPIHSALALVACFIQISALFVLLGSPFLAVIQIFVYVGAVMVLFLFVIMMLDVRKEAKTRFLGKGIIPIGLVLVILGLEMIFLLVQSPQVSQAMIPGSPIPLEEVSLALFRDYLLPFEVASVILLVALIGAVVLARDETADNNQNGLPKDKSAEPVEGIK